MMSSVLNFSWENYIFLLAERCDARKDGFAIKHNGLEYTRITTSISSKALLPFVA